MKKWLIMFAVAISISCNGLADWRVVVVVEGNPDDELIAEYDVNVGAVGGPYTTIATLLSSGSMYHVQTHTPGTGPFGYVVVARNVLGDEAPPSAEGVATEPPPPAPIPGPTPAAIQVLILGG